MLDLTGYAEPLCRLTCTDPDPRVRHRADALLSLARGRTVEETARAMGCCAKRIRVRRHRFLTEDREGLADRSRPGRPPALGTEARLLLETVLAASPLDYGYLVTVGRWPT